MKTALCIPTLNAGPFASRLLDSIQRQHIQPDQIIIVDSGSSDGSIEQFRDAGLRVEAIPGEQFDHGATRQFAADLAGDVDVVIFLTQDAILAGKQDFSNLLACFRAAKVGAAYGRQLPRQNAGEIEAHARLYNYPRTGRVKSASDIPLSGIKTAFISNSFAAYRRSALIDAGGFPPGVILGEDTCVAGRMLLQGWKIAYCAEAQVFHSHNYTIGQEFRRYFDIGVLHGRESWLRREFGQAGGEGGRFVKSELHYLLQRRPDLIPSALVRNGFKLMGYKLGTWEKFLPLFLKRRLSMHRKYWARGN